MSNAKVRARRRRRVRTAAGYAAEAKRWAPLTREQNRQFWKLVNFGVRDFLGGMQTPPRTDRAPLLTFYDPSQMIVSIKGLPLRPYQQATLDEALNSPGLFFVPGRPSP